MARWVSCTLSEIGSIVRYLYFLRFSLALWVFAWLLTILNGAPWSDAQAAHYPLRQLLSGIVTPEYEAQYLTVAFFVVSAGFVALVSARLVVINGNERFQAKPPIMLRLLLANDASSFGWIWESVAVLLSQAPTVLVFNYLIRNGDYEHVYEVSPGNQSVWGILWGALLAIAFWWVINAAFYATYELRSDADPSKTVQLGKNAARTILFPRWCFGLTPAGNLFSPCTLEGITMPLKGARSLKTYSRLGKTFLSVIGFEGYLARAEGRLYEAHAFSIPAVAGSIFLYLTMCPLTAPVPAISWAWSFFVVFMVLPALILLWAFWWSKSKDPGYGLLKWKIGFTIGIVGILGSIVDLYQIGDPERFPSFALVLIMVIAACWTLSVVAFAADRYRVPVLTVILLMMAIPRLAGWDGGKEEHYLSTAPPQPNAQLKSPQQILDSLRGHSAFPVLIVTATGGGLHASAWTASVLSKLEQTFNSTDDLGAATPFHEHILLVSTVSGGSVGLLTYIDQLAQLQAGQSLDAVHSTRMMNAAQCSSLEAAAWGLVYFDLPKAFLPVIPYFIKPSTGMDADGVNDLDKSPLLKDRTWALRKGFARNLHNMYCGSDGNTSGRNDLVADTSMTANILADEQKLSLANLLGPGIDPRIPAFTMNTTTVEGGTRFLLANYQVPRSSISGANESYPAQSFLDKYRSPSNPGFSIDLPLATAAQLSATFPYVSSASRIPDPADPNGLHFVDGGYYDNDGTASAIEFLRSALEKPANPGPPLRVIWVEIRNSGNPLNDLPTESSAAWNLLRQLMGPLVTFWSAGHESVTERNRVGLDLFEKAYVDKVHIERLVFADNNASDKVKTDPLNWSLTPLQRSEVHTSAEALGANFQAARNWFFEFDKKWAAEH